MDKEKKEKKEPKLEEKKEKVAKRMTEYRSKWRKSNKWRKLPKGDSGEQMAKAGYKLR